MIIKNYVHNLTLTDFRNYHFARIEVDARPVVLTGANGAGKTNLLEAISLLTPGRGLRRSALSEMDNSEHNTPWVVAGEVMGAQGPVTIGTGRDSNSEHNKDKRITRINGKNTRSQTELSKVFSTLWLTPQMDNLFIEGGTARRKFFDRLVYSFDSDHAARMNAYELAMRERNRLLSEYNADPIWLSALEQKMAEQGVAIATARKHTAEGLAVAMQKSEGAFPTARITFTGQVEKALNEDSALAAEETFRALLANARAQDAQTGRTSIGIHRTNIEVLHVNKNLPAERCSTGEQKALLVSIILAQTAAGAMWHNILPVLLLDEVATHLDNIRRQALFERLTALGAQCWLTATDKELFTGLNAQFLGVENSEFMKL